MKTLLLAAALGMVSTAALAATYTYDYSASFSSRTYDAARVSLTDTIQAMGTITGQITLDDTVIIESSPNQIRYVAPIITIDGIDMSLFERLPSSLTVYNDSANSDALRVGTPSYSSDMDGRYINSLSFNFSRRFKNRALGCEPANLTQPWRLERFNSVRGFVALLPRRAELDLYRKR